MKSFVISTLQRIITKGNLQYTDPDGETHTFGDGTGPIARFQIREHQTVRKIMWDPILRSGELFVDGKITIEQGTVYDVLELIFENTKFKHEKAWLYLEAARYLLRRFKQRNTLKYSRKNISHHYDLSDAHYRLFLDEDWQYSCAYFEEGNNDLSQAQLAKKRHIAAKLAIESKQNILDIGCGWGGMGLYLASMYDVKVQGVTLSQEQLKVANNRATKMNLSDKTEFKLQDYRTLDSKFERIVSVGMFEHVGLGHYKEFFKSVNRLLTDDGVMLLHSIGRIDGPGFTDPWTEKYIFPGGYIPALSEVLPVIERSGLVVTDIEILRLHYADTLNHWRQRFMQNRDKAEKLYDERFCRMWEYFLATAEIAFRFRDMMVFQIQICKEQEGVPLTRNYINLEEERLRQLDSSYQSTINSIEI